MTYLTINTKTKEGKELWEAIRKHSAVKELRTLNEETRQALRDAKAGGKGVKEIKDTHSWLNE